jgi:acyl-CoA thioesterase I
MHQAILKKPRKHLYSELGMNQWNISHQNIIHVLIITGLLSIPCFSQTKIACVGTSITAFQYTPGNYPEVLGKLLGPGYTVANNGFGGITVGGYMGCWMYPGVISGKPDIVTIELGTNDATANLNRTAFTADYNRLIDSFLAVSSHPRIWLVLPPPIWQPPNGYKSDTMALAIVPLVRSIAAQRGFPTIDLFTPMTGHTEWTGDGIHPNLVGNDTIAHIFYRALTDNPVEVMQDANAESWNPYNGKIKQSPGTIQFGKRSAGMRIEIHRGQESFDVRGRRIVARLFR